jgi:Na+/H+-dicarboxylate symporter
MDGRDLFGAIIRMMGFAAVLYPISTFGTIAASTSTLGPSRLVLALLVGMLPQVLVGGAVLYWAEKIVAFTYRKAPPRP